MFDLTNKEFLDMLKRRQCWFYEERVDDRRKLRSLAELFFQDMLSGMQPGEVCCFYIKNRDYIKLLHCTDKGLVLEVLTPESSKPYLDLEWIILG